MSFILSYSKSFWGLGIRKFEISKMKFHKIKYTDEKSRHNNREEKDIFI